MVPTTCKGFLLPQQRTVRPWKVCQNPIGSRIVRHQPSIVQGFLLARCSQLRDGTTPKLPQTHPHQFVQEIPKHKIWVHTLQGTFQYQGYVGGRSTVPKLGLVQKIEGRTPWSSRGGLGVVMLIHLRKKQVDSVGFFLTTPYRGLGITPSESYLWLLNPGKPIEIRSLKGVLTPLMVVITLISHL